MAVSENWLLPRCPDPPHHHGTDRADGRREPRVCHTAWGRLAPGVFQTLAGAVVYAVPVDALQLAGVRSGGCPPWITVIASLASSLTRHQPGHMVLSAAARRRSSGSAARARMTISA